MKRLLFLSAVLYLCCNTAYADLSDADLKKTTEQFMSLLADDKIKDAYKLITPSWPIPENEVNNMVEKTEFELARNKLRYGANIGFEFLGTKKLGESFIAYDYLQKFDRHANHWTFAFYKSKDGWRVNTIIFTDRLNTFYSSNPDIQAPNLK